MSPQSPPTARRAKQRVLTPFLLSYVYSIFFKWHLPSDATGDWGALTEVLVFLVSPLSLALHLVLVITRTLENPGGGGSWDQTNTFSAIGFVSAFVVSYVLVRKAQDRGTHSRRNSGNSHEAVTAQESLSPVKKRSVKILTIVALAVPVIFVLGLIPRPSAHTSTEWVCLKTWSVRHTKASLYGLMGDEMIVRSPYDKWLRDNGLFDGYDWVHSYTEERCLWGTVTAQAWVDSFPSLPIDKSAFEAFEKIRSAGKEAVLHRFHELYSTGDIVPEGDAIELLYSTAAALKRIQPAPATRKGKIQKDRNQ